jgi:hypothetical protein
VLGQGVTNPGIYGLSTSNYGVYGVSTSGAGVYGLSSSNAGIYGKSTSNYGGVLLINPSSTNNTAPVLKLERISSGTGASGIGGSIDTWIENTNNASELAGIYTTEYATATDGAEAADYTWRLRAGGVDLTIAATPKMRLTSAGSLKLAVSLNSFLDTASTDSYTITAPEITALVEGLRVAFKAVTANTGACSLAINSLGAISLKMKRDQDPGDNFIEAGSYVDCVYDGTNFQMMQPAAN